jgi:ubiquinone/menaquinone biosynthesis C-methylase UbiE
MVRSDLTRGRTTNIFKLCSMPTRTDCRHEPISTRNMGRGGWFSWLASQLDWRCEGDVLEVGCGAGWFWGEAASHLPARLRLQLTDLSHGMVTEALNRVRASAHWNQLEGRVADASTLPFPDASFDVVLASPMLYHLPDPRDGVTEIARVLRSNGNSRDRH